MENTVIKRLTEQNERCIKSGRYTGKPTGALRRRLASGQKPYAVVIGCSDSRVIPEILFDAEPGELFVIRTAGNTVGRTELASVDYALHHLGVTTVIVLGHTRCGAVAGALAGEFEGPVGAITKKIARAVGRETDPTEASRRSAVFTARALRRTLHADALTVVPALYDVVSGKVTWITE